MTLPVYFINSRASSSDLSPVSNIKTLLSLNLNKSSTSLKTPFPIKSSKPRMILISGTPQDVGTSTSELVPSL